MSLLKRDRSLINHLLQSGDRALKGLPQLERSSGSWERSLSKLQWQKLYYVDQIFRSAGFCYDFQVPNTISNRHNPLLSINNSYKRNTFDLTTLSFY
ncbi:MAG: hypothetical protein VKL59_01445 [Nostocaceae cyanobacterium]|nr:hypothetical protein [Nostocaceae cyanobacterium]